jgi:hypothetical protein
MRTNVPRRTSLFDSNNDLTELRQSPALVLSAFAVRFFLSISCLMRTRIATNRGASPGDSKLDDIDRPHGLRRRGRSCPLRWGRTSHKIEHHAIEIFVLSLRTLRSVRRAQSTVRCPCAVLCGQCKTRSQRHCPAEGSKPHDEFWGTVARPARAAALS